MGSCSEKVPRGTDSSLDRPVLLLPRRQTSSQSQWSRFQEPDWRSLLGSFTHTIPGCYRILPCPGPSTVLGCGLEEPPKKILSLGFPALSKILAPPPSGFRFPEHPPGPFPVPTPARVPRRLLDLEDGVTFLGQLLLGQVAVDRLRPRIYPASS